MFDYEYGAVNLLLGEVPASRSPINWLGEPLRAFEACIIANVWLGFPFMMVIALGGMQGIPAELYEAARIDRASRWQQFWHITLPLLKPVLLPAITLGAIWTFNNLNVIWLVSNGGEPQDSTHILVSYVYKAVFNLYRYGYGAALSMVMFLHSACFLGAVPGAHQGDRKRVRRIVGTRHHARTKVDHRDSTRRAAGICGNLDLSGAQRVLDFAAARQSPCGRRTCRSFPRTGRLTATSSCSPSSRFCAGSATRYSWRRW